MDKAAWDETVVDTPATTKTVVDKEAWDETTYTTELHNLCSVCGQDFEGWTEDQVDDHKTAHLLAGEGGWHIEPVQVPTTVHHDAQIHVVNHPREVRTEQKWVEG